MALRYGVLPVKGGLEDQPTDFIDALNIGLSIIFEKEKEVAERQEKAMNNG